MIQNFEYSAVYILCVYFVAHSLKNKMDESESIDCALSTLGVCVLTDE